MTRAASLTLYVFSDNKLVPIHGPHEPKRVTGHILWSYSGNTIFESLCYVVYGTEIERRHIYMISLFV